MAGAAANPTGVPHPCSAPPPIMPANSYVRQEDDYALALDLVAEILMDDEWHHIEDICDEVEWECELSPTATRKMLRRLQAHGDVRRDDEWVRLTTRWKSWSPEPDHAARVAALEAEVSALQRAARETKIAHLEESRRLQEQAQRAHFEALAGVR